MAAIPEDTLPTYVYAAASAMRSLEGCLWTMTKREQSRIILAALDSLPRLADEVTLERGEDWFHALGDDTVQMDAYADAFNAARYEGEIVLAERAARSK